jgi:uncharacterized Zn-binding protein involved in type VI secretion
MSQAARVFDPHSCPLSVPVAHGGGVIQGPGATSVVIGHLPAATLGTACACGLGPPNRIVGGSSSVVIDGSPAARAGDPTSHGGSILAGCSSVIIG